MASNDDSKLDSSAIQSDSKVVRAIEQSFIDGWLSLAYGIESCVEQTKDATFMMSNFADPLLNAVLSSHFTKDTDTAIERILQEALDRAVPFSWYVGPSTYPLDMRIRLTAKGFTFAERQYGMALSTDRIAPQNTTLPNLLSVQKVDSPELLTIWIDIFCEGYGASRILKQAIRNTYSVGYDSQEEVHYLAWYGEKPVATLTLTFGELGVASLFDVATTPAFRRQGVASELVRCAVVDAANLGHNLIVLQSSEVAQRVYEGLGFDHYCHFDRYELPVVGMDNLSN